MFFLRPLLALLLLAILAPTALAQTSTFLVRNTNPIVGVQKRTLVVIGDGFRSGADQRTFNDYVDNTLMDEVFDRGPLDEDLSAFDVVRVNVNSQQSGVTRVDSVGTVTTARSTALGYRFNGRREQCWMKPGPNTSQNLSAILRTLNLAPDYTFIVLNMTEFGGCRTGSRAVSTLGAGWPVAAHEMGHMVGNLGDEYTAQNPTPTAYTGGPVGAVNLSATTKRSQLKWRAFVDPGTPLPTTFNASTMSATETAGAFVGGTLSLSTGSTTHNAGLWHPTSSCRMNSNTPAFCPVCYNRMKEVLDPFLDHEFEDVYTGDFDGDGFADVVVRSERSLALYLANGDNLAHAETETGALDGPGGTWTLTHRDRLVVADFDGDGRDDLFASDPLPGMTRFGLLRSTGTGFELVRQYGRFLPGNARAPMAMEDRYLAGDFDGDGRDDLFVFNGSEGDTPVLTLLRSTGTTLQFVRRYEESLPGWAMASGDEFFVADFDGDDRDDLYIFNGRNWRFPYLFMARSTGNALAGAKRYDRKLPGWDDMKRNDRFVVADFNGDDRDDLYVFNGQDWSIPYLQKLASTGSQLTAGKRWDQNIPGWQMRPSDQHFVADINGDGEDDLYVYNATDWGPEYLGTLISDGNRSLSGSWQDHRVGDWNLGERDRFLVGDFNGTAGWDDLFVFNPAWFGLLRSGARSTYEVAIHRDWIHDHEYHTNNWW